MKQIALTIHYHTKQFLRSEPAWNSQVVVFQFGKYILLCEQSNLYIPSLFPVQNLLHKITCNYRVLGCNYVNILLFPVKPQPSTQNYRLFVPYSWVQ